MKNAVAVLKEWEDVRAEVEKVRLKYARVCFEEMTQQERMDLCLEAGDAHVELADKMVACIQNMSDFLEESPNSLVKMALEEAIQFMNDARAEMTIAGTFI